MKKLIILSLLCNLSIASAEEAIVPLNMELGHWVTTVEIDQSEMMEKLLANVPEGQREAMKQIMQQKMESVQKTDQCITKETLENFDQQLKDSLGDTGGAKNCTFDVVESSSEKFVGNLKCSGHVMNITTIAVNSKRNESTVVSNVPGVGEQKIASISEWQSATCPAGT